MAATYGKATPETFTPSTTGLILNVNVSNTSSYTGTGTNLADLSVFSFFWPYENIKSYYFLFIYLFRKRGWRHYSLFFLSNNQV